MASSKAYGGMLVGRLSVIINAGYDVFQLSLIYVLAGLGVSL